MSSTVSENVRYSSPVSRLKSNLNSLGSVVSGVNISTGLVWFISM